MLVAATYMITNSWDSQTRNRNKKERHSSKLKPFMRNIKLSRKKRKLWVANSSMPRMSLTNIETNSTRVRAVYNRTMTPTWRSRTRPSWNFKNKWISNLIESWLLTRHSWKRLISTLTRPNKVQLRLLLRLQCQLQLQMLSCKTNPLITIWLKLMKRQTKLLTISQRELKNLLRPNKRFKIKSNNSNLKSNVQKRRKSEH